MTGRVRYQSLRALSSDEHAGARVCDSLGMGLACQAGGAGSSLETGILSANVFFYKTDLTE